MGNCLGNRNASLIDSPPHRQSPRSQRPISAQFNGFYEEQLRQPRPPERVTSTVCNVCENRQQQQIYTITTESAGQMDSGGFTILSKNPDLRYKRSAIIMNDNYMGTIYQGSLSGKKVSIKEFTSKATIDREVAILSNIDHSNIVKFLLQVEMPQSPSKRFFLATEFAEKLSRNVHLNTEEARKEGKLQVSAAVFYLQKMKIVHCEIVPESIFVTNSGGSRTFKLANFTKAMKIQGPAPYNGEYVTEYSAPEICGCSRVHLSSDIWSLACVFFHFWTSQQLNAVIFENQMNKFHARIKCFTGKSTSILLLKDLLLKMLQFDPKQRLAIANVQQHPYFWNTSQMTGFVLEISKILEEDKNNLFGTFLSKGSHKVIGESWVARLEDDVKNELMTIKKTRSAKYAKNDLNEKGIRSLITTIRNLIAHARTPIIKCYMGENDDEFMKYWNLKFPNLIEHMYNAKLQYHDENIA